MKKTLAKIIIAAALTTKLFSQEDFFDKKEIGNFHYQFPQEIGMNYEMRTDEFSFFPYAFGEITKTGSPLLPIKTTAGGRLEYLLWNGKLNTDTTLIWSPELTTKSARLEFSKKNLSLGISGDIRESQDESLPKEIELNLDSSLKIKSLNNLQISANYNLIKETTRTNSGLKTSYGFLAKFRY